MKPVRNYVKCPKKLHRTGYSKNARDWAIRSQVPGSLSGMQLNDYKSAWAPKISGSQDIVLPYRKIILGRKRFGSPEPKNKDKIFMDKQNGNPLDDYVDTVTVLYRKFRVQPGKLVGWQRLMGQEVPQDMYSDASTIAGASVFRSNFVGLTVFGTTTPAAVSPVNANFTTRQLGKICFGYQTPAVSQPVLDLWIPLLFWFNKDVRLSIPSVSIPFGQRFITMTLATQAQLSFPAAGNLFLQLATEVFLNADGTDTGAAITNYKRFVTRQPVILSTSTVATGQTISLMELYINNIFMNPEVHDI